MKTSRASVKSPSSGQKRRDLETIEKGGRLRALPSSVQYTRGSGRYALLAYLWLVTKIEAI